MSRAPLSRPRASISALIDVSQRLRVDADYVVFGHVHRLGPPPTMTSAEWEDPTGRPRVVNTGSRIYEPLLMQHVTPPHRYWPGGAASLEDERDPQVIGLLDAMPGSTLR